MEKSEEKKLEEKLFNNKKSGWEGISEEDKKIIFKFSDEYIEFLNKSKTEREFVLSARKILDENGNYTEEWDNEGVIKGVELKLKDVAFKRATLDDNGEYYCIFKIQDIYGNVYYSDLMHLN